MNEEKNEAPETGNRRQESALTTLNSIESLELQLRFVDTLFKYQDQIRKKAVLLTAVNDWIDQDGKPYLQETGAAKIAVAFSVSQEDLHCERERDHDDLGDFITFTWTAKMTAFNRSIVAIGTSSTRDELFGKRKGEGGKKMILPLSEIDIMDVKKKGWTNLMNRGIKDLLGLSYTWADVEALSDGKITLEKCRQFSYAKGARGGRNESAGAGELRSSIWNRLLEQHLGDIEAAKADLRTLTKYGSSQGRDNVADLTEGQLKFVDSKLRERKPVDQHQATAPSPERK